MNNSAKYLVAILTGCLVWQIYVEIVSPPTQIEQFVENAKKDNQELLKP